MKNQLHRAARDVTRQFEEYAAGRAVVDNASEEVRLTALRTSIQTLTKALNEDEPLSVGFAKARFGFIRWHLHDTDTGACYASGIACGINSAHRRALAAVDRMQSRAWMTAARVRENVKHLDREIDECPSVLRLARRFR